MRLKFITLDLEHSTIETTWVEDTETAIVPVESRNYSVEQMDEFIAAVPNAALFTTAIGWA